MKTQSGYEFYVALMIFITSVVFLFYEIVVYYPAFSVELKKEVLYSQAYKISQLLINDPGEPRNWYLDISNAKRIGLQNESFQTLNVLSQVKAIALNSTCNQNYDTFKKLLGVNYNISIVFKLTNNSYVINCTRVMYGENVAKISRIAAMDDGKSYGELIIWVY
ncbi:MAG: hypothetical protein RMJ18_00335 [Candidatus Aenigmarchaeota archaeon]|nr:hypothetical protein [Candidatus Aenigmarchaeota archaeon]MCX8190860.1 hypothetical protein [Candidatus Aenigmarchaeota archaeon]MDW8159862.1 hypothetical protein [Candidatus Aenigmarchaeota archaeon]